jgi:hypothetical protein
MTQGCGWWLAMLAGWSLLCLVHCSDSGLDDHAPAVQTVTEPTIEGTANSPTTGEDTCRR